MHIFVAITAHGYGHLSQVAPVVNALAAHYPAVRITVQATLARAIIDERLHGVTRVVEQAADVGMHMDGPLRIRWDASLAAYRTFMAVDRQHRARQRAVYAQDRPDLVIADVPWLPLQVAAHMAIPAVGLCSLNWRDILCEGSHAGAIGADLDSYLSAAYRSADLFIRPQPCMPMAWLPQAVEVGPIARVGRDRGVQLRAYLGLAPASRLVLVQFGGVPAGELLAGWPYVPGVHWLLGMLAVDGSRGDMTALADVPFAFIDAVASADALITKPGYGTFAEAACHSLPTLYVPRGDWAEEPWLMRWLDARVATACIGPEQLRAGDFVGELQRLLDSPRKAADTPDGIAQSVGLIQRLLATRADGGGAVSS